ncbi:MAG: ecotin family protein [Proteobacteria bacterium]|nr:ecotin family protein [Pseudomonadota bacterium]
MPVRSLAAPAFAALMMIATPAVAADNLEAFPPADAGMKRVVIDVPPKPDEFAFKVELQVGRTVEVDKHNRHFFGGRIETETIQGWGFDRYIVRALGPMGGTLMAVDPNEPKVSRFVALRGDPFLVRYNSKLPLVVYVPVDAEVRYRVWRADPEFTVAK